MNFEIPDEILKISLELLEQMDKQFKPRKYKELCRQFDALGSSQLLKACIKYREERDSE